MRVISVCICMVYDNSQKGVGRNETKNKNS